MHNRNLLLICITSFLTAFIILAFNREWVIVRICTQQSAPVTNNQTPKHKKKVTLFFWRANSWHHETTDILVAPDDMAFTISNLLTSWLSLLDEEHLMKKTVCLQSVLLSASGHEAYISFDRNPLDKEDTTHAKWLWIEALLKTLRDNDIKVQNVYFLAHHTVLNDYHLDFSKPWPLQGFL